MADPDLSQFLAPAKTAPPPPDLSQFMAAPQKPQDAGPEPKAKAAKPGEDIPVVGPLVQDFNDVARQRTDALKHDFTTKPGHGVPLRVAKTAADVAGYALGGFDAAGRNLVGRPVAAGAGLLDKFMGHPDSPEVAKKTKENVGDLSTMAIPFNAGAKAVGAAGKVEEAAKAAEKIVSPATVDDNARAAANLHRQILGKRGIEADKAAYDLGKHQKVVGNASPEDQLAVIRYVENRSKKMLEVPDWLTKAKDAEPGVSIPDKYVDMAKAKGVRSADGLWFLYGDKPVFWWNGKDPTILLGQDSRKLSSYKKLVDKNSTAWYKPGEEERARKLLTLGSAPWGSTEKSIMLHRLKGDLLGYPPDAVDKFVSRWAQNEGARYVPRSEQYASYYKTEEIDPKYKPAADAIKSVADRYRKQIEYVFGKNGPNFVTDYYARMWKQKPADVERAIAKQGSGKNLKARSLPTYEDGLKAGLTPVYPNPLDAMTAYSENMGRFLATHEILDGMEKSPQVAAKWFIPGKQPEGWVPLKGVQVRTPEKLIVKSGKGVVGRQPEKMMYAPEGAARVYNNYISKGLDQGDAGPIYRSARAVSNGLVQLKLGLSAFHASVMGQEGIISEMARGIKQVSQGDAKGLATMAKAPAAPVTSYRRGAKMLDQITGKTAPAAFDSKLNAIYEKTGQRLGMDKIYATRNRTSLFASALRGTFQKDLQQALQTTYKGSAGDRVKGVLDLTGNIIQSTAAPLFEHYIPNIKRGAWAQQMSDFLKADPTATEAEQTAYGQKLADSIDNRFGELVVNNNFWNKSAYQIGQLLMLSPSWNIGTAREIGGGVLNIPKSLKGVVQGKGVDDKTAYVAALVGTTMLENGVATYMHTGQMPDGADWFAYRTGGTDPATGKPERAMLPGYMKDVLAWGLEGPGKEAMNKLNPGLKALTELASNKDYKQQPIRDTNAPVDKQAGQVAEYAAEQASPIAFGDSSKPKKGSKLSGLERFMAVRPAPRYLTDQKGVKAAEQKRARRDWRSKERTDQRTKAREAE